MHIISYATHNISGLPALLLLEQTCLTIKIKKN
jgi:hypothetical protein